MALPSITTFGWVPEFARGFVRDIRPRWAFEEVGQPYEVRLITDAKSKEHLRSQPFGQVPTYRDDEVELFESGAIVLRIAERAGALIPQTPNGRIEVVQWLAAALNSVEPAIMDNSINEVFEADKPWRRDRRPLVQERLNRRLAGLESIFERRRWLVADEFSVADLLMASVLGELRPTKALESFAMVASYVRRCEDRPAFRKAMTDHLGVFDAP